MKKSNCLKVILSSMVVLLLVFGANNIVLGYGDGGGGGGGGGAGGDGGGGDAASRASALTLITKLTPDELIELLSPLESKYGIRLPESAQSLQDRRRLLEIRQAILEHERQITRQEASDMAWWAEKAEDFDWAARRLQFAMAFVPVAGWAGLGTVVATNAALGAAYTYRDSNGESSTADMVTNAAVAGTVSGIIKKISPGRGPADRALNKARLAWGSFLRTTKETTTLVTLQRVKENSVKYVVIKGTEKVVKGAIIGALSVPTSEKQVPHREAPPIHSHPTVIQETRPGTK